jgi:glyceraldehyde-3-phosphate dehydrogenase (NADP+)
VSASAGFFANNYLSSEDTRTPPQVDGLKYVLNGELVEWTGTTAKVFSPILRQDGGQIQLGVYPMMEEADAEKAINAAAKAWNHGRGDWPLMLPSERIARIELFLEGLRARSKEIAEVLMWEICKTEADATKEVTRTISYVEDTIKALKDLENKTTNFERVGGILARIKRCPYGITLCVGPFNYPFNETYTTLIPALIMGNPVVMKLPRTGVLCHMPTMELFQKYFPPGVINIVSGAGRATLPAIMKTGLVDVLGFIGSSDAASSLTKAHPMPGRLRLCLGLEAKNAGIILPDADLQTAVSECLLGSLSYNGQRCTAIKIIFVHSTIAETFMAAFTKAVDGLVLGLPWQKGVGITPLAEPPKPKFLQDLIDDAVGKGAQVVNARGGHMDRTFVFPSVVYPINNKMRLWHEEQFGPVVPVTTFTDIEEVYQFFESCPYGQQAAVFGQSPESMGPLLDILVNQVARVNINSQCQRGPDAYPFTGRKNSANATLSISDALRVFSIRSVVAIKDDTKGRALTKSIVSQHSSNFMSVDSLF